MNAQWENVHFQLEIGYSFQNLRTPNRFRIMGEIWR